MNRRFRYSPLSSTSPSLNYWLLATASSRTTCPPLVAHRCPSMPRAAIAQCTQPHHPPSNMKMLVKSSTTSTIWYQRNRDQSLVYNEEWCERKGETWTCFGRQADLTHMRGDSCSRVKGRGMGGGLVVLGAQGVEEGYKQHLSPGPRQDQYPISTSPA